MSADAVTYCNCMEEAKARIALIRAVNGGTVTTQSEDFDQELVFLQFRKVLELIAFASISANKAVYSSARRKFATDWNAKRMLEHLEKVNPEFYPMPVREAPPKVEGTRHFEQVVEGVLTKGEFVVLYDKCGQVLHARNPFSSPSTLSTVEYTAAEWTLRIQTLLNLHRVALIDSQYTWLISMNHTVDGKVYAYIADSKQAGP